MNKNSSSHKKLSDLLTSIGNPVRVPILLAIGGSNEVCVCHLESLLGLRQAYISQQLMLLRKQQIITSRRDGKYVYYQLAKPEILEIIRSAGKIVGVAEDALLIQESSNCECPKCKMKDNIISTNQLVRGEV